MSKAPRVSVVMPAYNNDKYVTSAVQSILSQRYRDFEMIVIDDGSRDNTAECVARLAHKDSRVRLVSQSNTGIVGALNHGLELARGELIARMDSDDISFPCRFSRQIAFLDQNPHVVLLGTQIINMDQFGRLKGIRGEEFEHDPLVHALMTGKSGAIMHPTIMMRRDALDRAGHYREEFKHVEDLDLFLRMAEVGEIRNLPRPLLNYRLHESSVCHVHREEQKGIKENVIRDALNRRGRNDEPVVIDISHPAPDRFYKLFNDALIASRRDQRLKACAIGAVAVGLRPTRRESWQLVRDFSNPIIKHFKSGTALQ